MDELIEKYALANAIKYGGKASTGNIIGQIIQEKPEFKTKVKELHTKAAHIVAAINKLSLIEQRERLEKLAPELLEKKEHKEHDLFGFVEVKEGQSVISGFPPEPSKYPHIGHAKALFINYEFAKRHNGKFILRFDDTNPVLAKDEFYKIHLENYSWLGIKPDSVEYATDAIERLHGFAEKLIEMGHAYVCNCEADTVNALRYKGEPCPHRERSNKESLALWKTLSEGSVLRLKIKSDHKNTAMRDPTIFRVITAPHCRVANKFTVWPTYDFETSVMDGLEDVSHRFRTKEFELRNALHNHIQTLLGFRPTTYIDFARFNMVGVESQGRVIREKVESGELLGWDDPSLTTIVALRRRGFTAQAIKSFVLATGITKNEATLTWDDLYVHNRRVLNEVAKRMFFVENPTPLTIIGAPRKTVKLSFFPGSGNAERIFETAEEFLVSEEDVFDIEPGQLYRLMDCVNFEKDEKNVIKFHSADIETFRKHKGRIMHFLPANYAGAHTTIMMPDKTVKMGLAEQAVKTLKIGDIIQFERVGFCRLDAIKDNIYSFWFTHK